MDDRYNNILESERDLLEKCVEVWGEDAQINKAIEEMAELIQELCKWIGGANNGSKVTEETVDVLIMINQLTIILAKNHKEFEEVLKFKLFRLRQMLSKDIHKKELENEISSE